MAKVFSSAWCMVCQRFGKDLGSLGRQRPIWQEGLIIIITLSNVIIAIIFRMDRIIAIVNIVVNFYHYFIYRA